jgi:hypothetical protein
MPAYTDTDLKQNGMVEFWDLGPERPIAPDPPVEPKKTGRAVDDAVAAQGYEDALQDFKNALRRYAAEKREYDHHRLNIGGAIKGETWPILAESMVTDWPGRYVKELPASATIGKAHIEAEQRRAEEAKERQRIKERDPHMGRPQAVAP